MQPVIVGWVNKGELIQDWPAQVSHLDLTYVDRVSKANY